MAYTNNEWRLQVRGNIGSSEQWNNTWTFLDTVGGQDVEDVSAILGEFYEDITGFASWMSAAYTVVGATAKNLGTGALIDLAPYNLAGASAADRLPSQVAVRVSLSDMNGHRGGPFIAGFTVNAVTLGLVDAGLLGDFVTALETMGNSLTTAGWQLRIDRPSVDSTVAALVGRLGERFDVIRKRANDTAEAYVTFSTS